MNPARRPGVGRGTDWIAVAGLFAVAASSAGGYGRIKQEIRDAVHRDPMDAAAVTVLGGAWLFFLAERGHNPKILSYWDSLVFVSTSLSVGYADSFARTPAGKALASALMTFGPALSARFFDVPSPGGAVPPGGAPREESADLTPEMLRVQTVIAEKLEKMLGLMEQRAGS